MSKAWLNCHNALRLHCSCHFHCFGNFVLGFSKEKVSSTKIFTFPPFFNRFFPFFSLNGLFGRLLHQCAPREGSGAFFQVRIFTFLWSVLRFGNLCPLVDPQLLRSILPGASRKEPEEKDAGRGFSGEANPVPIVVAVLKSSVRVNVYDAEDPQNLSIGKT